MRRSTRSWSSRLKASISACCPASLSELSDGGHCQLCDITYDLSLDQAVEAMRTGIDELPSDQHEAIQRHCIKGETLEETAQAMGKTPGAVRALVHRGKGKLQEWLDRSAIWLSGDRS